jgi:hypothetical protein
MALARGKVKQVTEKQVVEVTKAVPDGVTLELTQDEAEIIYYYTAKAYGVGKYRKASDRVYVALQPHIKTKDGYGNPLGINGMTIHIDHGNDMDAHHQAPNQ